MFGYLYYLLLLVVVVVVVAGVPFSGSFATFASQVFLAGKG